MNAGVTLKRYNTLEGMIVWLYHFYAPLIFNV